MKRKYLNTFLVISMIFVLAACSSLQLPGSQAEAADTSAEDLSVQAGQPLQDRLAIGTLSLEGTDQAVTPEQAKTLLPLWKAVKSLSASDTAAQAEIEAVYTQIQESMTAGQIQVIQEMSIDPEETQALLEKYGVELQMPEGAGMNPEDLSEDERATRIAQFRAEGGGGGQFQPGGGGPGGGMGRGAIPPDGAMPEGGPGMVRPEMEGTPGAPMGGRGGFRGGFNLRLVDPLIELLQERAGL